MEQKELEALQKKVLKETASKKTFEPSNLSTLVHANPNDMFFKQTYEELPKV